MIAYKPKSCAGQSFHQTLEHPKVCTASVHLKVIVFPITKGPIMILQSFTCEKSKFRADVQTSFICSAPQQDHSAGTQKGGETCNHTSWRHLEMPKV